jgi:hypothetical protein
VSRFRSRESQQWPRSPHYSSNLPQHEQRPTNRLSQTQSHISELPTPSPHQYSFSQVEPRRASVPDMQPVYQRQQYQAPKVIAELDSGSATSDRSTSGWSQTTYSSDRPSSRREAKQQEYQALSPQQSQEWPSQQQKPQSCAPQTEHRRSRSSNPAPLPEIKLQPQSHSQLPSQQSRFPSLMQKTPQYATRERSRERSQERSQEHPQQFQPYNKQQYIPGLDRGSVQTQQVNSYQRQFQSAQRYSFDEDRLQPDALTVTVDERRSRWSGSFS